MRDDIPASVPTRRSFFARLAAGAAAFGLGAGAAEAQAPPAGRWQPARHAEDDWYDTLPGKHRFFLDAVSPNGTGEAIAFATNYFAANRSGYKLEDHELAVVICLRHLATPFAFNDAIWAKYGAALSEMLKFVDPRTSQAPTVNVYNATDAGGALPNRGIALDALARRGVHYAVCDMATRRFAGGIARATKSESDAVYKELVANPVSNCHFVSAGIVAVDRAQERGYSFAYVG
jgi:intracellular sulfur oxidation DsrE/DsrF family protein